MEKTAIINAEINSGNSVDEFEKDLRTIEERLTGIEKGIRNVNKSDATKEAEKNFHALNRIVEEGALSVQDMGKAIENYKNIAAVSGRESPIGQEAIKRAAEMQDKVDGLTRDISNLANDGRKLQASLQLGTTVIAGYQAFSGVTAMLGVENEELLETLTRLQAIQGTLQAVETIRLNLEKESFLVIQAKSTAIKTMTALQYAWNVAMSLNPIGLIVAGLTALGIGISWLLDKLDIFSGAWEGITSLFSGLWDWISSITEGIYNMGSAIVDFVENSKAARIALGILTLGASEWGFAIKRVVTAYYESGAVSKQITDAIKKAQAEKIKGLRAELKTIEDVERKRKEAHDNEIRAINFDIEKRKAAGENYVDLEEKKLKSTITRIQQELKFEQERFEIVNQIESSLFKDFTFLNETKTKFLDEQRQKRIDKQKELQLKLEDSENSLTVFEIGENKKRADDYKKKADEKLAKEKEFADKKKELIQQYEDAIADLIKDEDEKSITKLQLKHQRERDALIEKYGKESELLKILEGNQAIERNNLLDEIAEMDKTKEEERQLKKIEDDKKIAEMKLAVLVEANKKLEEEDQRHFETKKMIEEALFNVSQSTVDGIAALGNIAIRDQEKLAKFNATITAAQMALDTAKAISNVIAGATAAAAAGGPAAPFLIAGYVASGIATVIGNMKTAIDAFRQAKVGSAPTLTGSSASAQSNSSNSSINTRQENGQTFTNQGQGSNSQVVSKVIVLDSELKAIRLQNENIINTATLP